jgi:hypothetical protein
MRRYLIEVNNVSAVLLPLYDASLGSITVTAWLCSGSARQHTLLECLCEPTEL